MIEYREDIATLAADQLRGGFFEGWPSPPCPEVHLSHLHGAEVAIVAVFHHCPGCRLCHGRRGWRSDCVHPVPRGTARLSRNGIGAELLRLVLARLSDRYSIDLVCDPGLVPFYERLGGVSGTAMMWRNRDTPDIGNQ